MFPYPPKKCNCEETPTNANHTCEHCGLTTNDFAYDGENLVCLDINNQDSLTVSIQKIEEFFCGEGAISNILTQIQNNPEQWSEFYDLINNNFNCELIDDCGPVPTTTTTSTTVAPTTTTTSSTSSTSSTTTTTTTLATNCYVYEVTAIINNGSWTALTCQGILTGSVLPLIGDNSYTPCIQDTSLVLNGVTATTDFVDCNPISTTTTTTTCITPIGTELSFYSGVEYAPGSGIYFNFTISQAAACAAINTGVHSYAGPLGVYKETLEVGTVVYDSAFEECTLLPTGYYIIFDLLLKYQIVYIIDGIVDSFPTCDEVLYNALQFGYSAVSTGAACSEPLAGIYFSNCDTPATVGIGCVIFLDSGIPTYAADGYYSDGLNVYTISGGFGSITAIGACYTTTTTTTAPSTTTTTTTAYPPGTLVIQNNYSSTVGGISASGWLYFITVPVLPETTEVGVHANTTNAISVQVTAFNGVNKCLSLYLNGVLQAGSINFTATGTYTFPAYVITNSMVVLIVLNDGPC